MLLTAQSHLDALDKYVDNCNKYYLDAHGDKYIYDLQIIYLDAHEDDDVADHDKFHMDALADIYYADFLKYYLQPKITSDLPPTETSGFRISKRWQSYFDAFKIEK